MKKNLLILLIFTSTFTIYSCKKSETTTNTISYNKFKINSVTLNAFPSTDNTGATWDLFVNTDPDVYFNIDSSGTNLYYGGASYLNNLTQSSLPSSWPALPSPQLINNLSATYYISLVDSDFSTVGDSDDPMGKISFMMNDHKTGYPSSFQITNGTSTVTINGTWF